jgi:ribosomal protein L30/L7E
MLARGSVGCVWQCLGRAGVRPVSALALAAVVPTSMSHRCATATTSAGAVSAAATAPRDDDGAVNVVPPSCQAVAGPYERVGNVFLVQCVDLPVKYTRQINAVLRKLRFEFRGQWTVHPDTPEVREALFRVRHIVRIEQVPLDEMKRLLGMPAHVRFGDLEAGLPRLRGRGVGAKHPYVASMVNFNQFRRMRIKDVLERDAVELRLLAARKQLRRMAEQREPPQDSNGGSQ